MAQALLAGFFEKFDTFPRDGRTDWDDSHDGVYYFCPAERAWDRHCAFGPAGGIAQGV